MFDRDVASFAKSQSWEVIETIHQSEHKKTAILKIILAGRDCIAKLCLEAAPVEIKETLVSEAKYYSLFSGVSHIPQLIERGEGYLIIEFVEGVSIFTFSQQTRITRNQIVSLAGEVEKSILEFNSVPSENNHAVGKLGVYRLVLSRFRDLCLSGPKGTKVGLYQNIQLKCLCYFSLPFVMVLLTKHVPKLMSDESMLGQRYHADLHMNNFLVDESLRVHLIDFECTKEQPLLFLDLAYSCATFVAVFNNKENVIPVFTRSLNTVGSAKASFDYILNILVSIAKLNPRFSGGTVTKIGPISFIRILMGS